MSDINKIRVDSTTYDLRDKNGRVMSETLIRDTVGYTNKNMFPYLYDETDANPAIRNGIVYTVNTEDGSVTVNGTATSDSWFTLGNTAAFKAQFTNGKKYSLMGCPSGGSVSTYCISISGISKQETGNGITLDWSASITGIYINVKSGTTVSNLIFYPIILEESIENTSFERSFLKVNDTVQYLCNTNVKNYRPPFYDESKNGITLVNNSDQSVVLNGTATARAEFAREFSLKKGTYIIYADGTNIPSGSNENVWFNINIISPSGNHDLFVNKGHRWKRFTLSQDSTVKTRLYIENNVTVSNMTLYTMVCDINSGRISYQPYAMNNRELTEGVNTLNNRVFGVTRLSSSDDLDDLYGEDKVGWYDVTNSSPAHAPSVGIGWSIMQVLYGGNCTYQIIYVSGTTIAMRKRSGSPQTWSSWAIFTGVV